MGQPTSGYPDDGNGLFKAVLVLTKGFPHPPFDLVAQDRISQFLPYGCSQLGMVMRRRQKIKNAIAIHNGLTLVMDLLEILMGLDPMSLRIGVFLGICSCSKAIGTCLIE